MKNSSPITPLAKAMAEASQPQATPLDVFRLARGRWLKGERLSLCDLARELGLSRGKLYRWVGNKELLLDEILWSLSGPEFERTIRETPGNGIDHVVEVHRRFMTTVLSFKPLQQFVRQDPTYALRILTRDAIGSYDRLVHLAADHIRAQAEKGYLSLSAPADKIAEVLIRTNESIIFSNIISGRSPAIEQACAVTRALLTTGRIPDCLKTDPDATPA